MGKDQEIHLEYHIIKKDLILDLLYLIASSILILVIYSNISFLARYDLFPLKFGSLILLIAIGMAIKHIYRIINNLKHGFKGLRTYDKFIMILILILPLLIFYQNQEPYFPIVNQIDTIKWENFNLFVDGVTDRKKVSIVSEDKNLLKQIFWEPDLVSGKTKKIENLILKYINIKRKEHSLEELKLDNILSDVARKHSLDMAIHNYFFHINLRGEDVFLRIKKEDYNIYKKLNSGLFLMCVGENLGKASIKSSEDDADFISRMQVDSWMRSPEHRANILDSDYVFTGIGIVYHNGEYISTQIFR